MIVIVVLEVIAGIVVSEHWSEVCVDQTNSIFKDMAAHALHLKALLNLTFNFGLKFSFCEKKRPSLVKIPLRIPQDFKALVKSYRIL